MEYTDINKYFKDKRLSLYNHQIKNKRIIYLDINFWIRLRDQESEKDKNFLYQITRLLHLKKCVFPISEITFWEVLKQSNKETLLKTISLIDKFSEGIALIPKYEMIHLETLHFLRSLDNVETYDLNELVWTKISFLLGYPNIEFDTIAQQVSFFEFMDNQSFVELFEMSYKEIDVFEYKDNIEVLNYNKVKYASENNSFKQMFISELEGYLIAHDLNIKEVLRLYLNRELKETDFNYYSGLIGERLKHSELNRDLPMFRIFPKLMASTRWDKDRKHKDGNDTMDFLHASFALPYCDYFFTEKELKTRIIQQKLDDLYHCQVESNIDDVLRLLRNM